MPDLLLEFLSEEIPARMQAKAADDLRRLVIDRLEQEGLVSEGARAFVTPRRLALTVRGIPAKQPDVKEEKKGPRVGAPENAIIGFLKSAGLRSVSEAKVQSDKKGDYYVALIEKQGRPAIEVIKDVLHATIATFPWPKSMRWGEQSGTPGSLSWVRPLHSIVATFGPETEEPEIVLLDIGGIKAGNETRGHRFMAPQVFKVRHFDDYVASLQKAKVMLDPARRAETILTDAKNLAFAQGYEVVDDGGLLDEVAGLVEWPVTLMGSFDEAFLAIPGEVIRATIRNNQKCFVLRDPQTAKLVNKFILVANEEAKDGGKAIVAGNERVIRARLSDARFFYDMDLKTRLEDRLPKFSEIVFHEKLGTQAERIVRITALAGELAGIVGADRAKAERAAQLCKADLLTEVVGEFPEMQGVMGRYLAEAQGEDEAVAHACEDHYKPKGPDDLVPSDPVSVAVALADKIDTLVGFWAIDEKPTGSKDPYALRRAALGVIRLILENKIRLNLPEAFGHGVAGYISQRNASVREGIDRWTNEKTKPGETVRQTIERVVRAYGASDLQAFVKERLKFQLRSAGAKYDLVEAVFAGYDDLFLIVSRLDALVGFLNTDDGKNLLSGYRRASNILEIEEKKHRERYQGPVNSAMLKVSEEVELAKAVQTQRDLASAAIQNENFQGAMAALSHLRPYVDTFFDKVTVNVDDKALRENRLKLLNEIRQATRAVADFSRIEG